MRQKNPPWIVILIKELVSVSVMVFKGNSIIYIKVFNKMLKTWRNQSTLVDLIHYNWNLIYSIWGKVFTCGSLGGAGVPPNKSPSSSSNRESVVLVGGVFTGSGFFSGSCTKTEHIQGHIKLYKNWNLETWLYEWWQKIMHPA